MQLNLFFQFLKWSCHLRKASSPLQLEKKPVYGFTLIEIIAVLVILGILAVVAVVYYASLLDDSKSRGASILVAAAQSQLSLEFARRATAGLSLDVDSQPVCEWVVISKPEVTSSIVCTGKLSENVAITATIDGKSFEGSWPSPVAGGS